MPELQCFVMPIIAQTEALDLGSLAYPISLSLSLLKVCTLVSSGLGVADVVNGDVNN